MDSLLAITKLYLIALWRKTKLFLGRLFWFWIAYAVGRVAFESDIAASILAGIVAVMTGEVLDLLEI